MLSKNSAPLPNSAAAVTATTVPPMLSLLDWGPSQLGGGTNVRACRVVLKGGARQAAEKAGKYDVCSAEEAGGHQTQVMNQECTH